MVSYRVIGQSIPRTDGVEKATGTARYTADIPMQGALWGKVLRSPYPHARITRIDTSRARQVPGVHGVLTGADLKGVVFGRQVRDVPVLAQDRVRFVGERVAAVAAVDEDTAQQALELIDVTYQELPALLDPLEAMKEDAQLLHPKVMSYEGLPQPLEKASNVFEREVWSRGDVAQGFAEADLVVENTFTTARMHQAYLEPHTYLVWIDEEGRVQVWASSKIPYNMRKALAACAGIPEERILVNHAYIGGDFGGKGFMDEPLCYFLAFHTRMPVRMAMEYPEEFMAGNPRQPSITRLKTGLLRDGTLVAHQAQVIYNSGAYGGYLPLGHLPGSHAAAGAYRTPHAYVEAMEVYTNTVPGGYMRSPGETQAVFAMESHMNDIARRLGMDPLELRTKNLMEEGEETLTSRRYGSVHCKDVRAKEVLEAVVEASSYRAPTPANVGRGMAIADRRASGGGTGHAGVTLNPDGSAILHTPIFEQGTGSYTSLRQMVAEEFALPIERVRVEVWNTDGVPFDEGVLAGRVTRIEGQAVHLAAQEARQEVVRLTAELLGWPEEHLTVEGESVRRQDTGEVQPWAGILARTGRSVTGQGKVVDWSLNEITAFTAQVAEVSVDPETGEVRLLRYTTAHDVGTIINPLGHQGQIDGAVIQGLGYATMEELRVEEGQVTNLSFGDYKIPNINDIPPLQTVLVQSERGVGPYNAKWIGEGGALSLVAPAIANAVEDAVGVRIRDLPLTAEKVHRALRARKA